jgi:uncharacterized protein YdiU (UPF0061 family)
MGRRYRFAQQPAIAQWNCVRLGEALAPLFADDVPLQAGIDAFRARYVQRYDLMNRAKFGLAERHDGDDDLMRDAFALLYDANTDYTNFFRALSGERATSEMFGALFGDASGHVFYVADALTAHRARFGMWFERWQERVMREARSASARASAMQRVNPVYVLRNYLAQEAIDAAERGDPSRVHTLLALVQHPYDDHHGDMMFAAKRPEWAKTKVGCSMLSCSS